MKRLSSGGSVLKWIPSRSGHSARTRFFTVLTVVDVDSVSGPARGDDRRAGGVGRGGRVQRRAREGKKRGAAAAARRGRAGWRIGARRRRANARDVRVRETRGRRRRRRRASERASGAGDGSLGRAIGAGGSARAPMSTPSTIRNRISTVDMASARSRPTPTRCHDASAIFYSEGRRQPPSALDETNARRGSRAVSRPHRTRATTPRPQRPSRGGDDNDSAATARERGSDRPKRGRARGVVDTL